ncbi:MAG: hypothetical protein R2825_25730 [Saprospiraceae bacterium]
MRKDSRRYVESLSSYIGSFGPDEKAGSGLYQRDLPSHCHRAKSQHQQCPFDCWRLTEIYDYLRLLFARIRRTYSPISGDQVKRHFTSVVDFIQSQPEGTRIQCLCRCASNTKTVRWY